MEVLHEEATLCSLLLDPFTPLIRIPMKLIMRAGNISPGGSAAVFRAKRKGGLT